MAQKCGKLGMIAYLVEYPRVNVACI